MESLINCEGLELIEEAEAMDIAGGRGFAYDVGRVFRFIGIAAVYGVPSALTDAASTSWSCNC
ncbi:hypothetical protein EDD80_101136 [Anseongella ginsenosidimutans]|uniref:Uncharacterized protein n=1 Tax=Anseongella ginsenosidimutans TaxID=496056 RepID=A0A4R3KW30_9SPHI|nr:hypothetical protein [Anseongella ginsenosidimutans]QEC51360.1 hypothetical protein FRZ59_02675 [Anseongella ginsenosidimutans]TCS89939.1 hypothetical protein EDD80_101136 [Anseongella ginsenosidimutans]